MDEFEALFGDMGDFGFGMETAKREFMDLGTLAVGTAVGGMAYAWLDKNAISKIPGFSGFGEDAKPAGEAVTPVTSKAKQALRNVAPVAVSLGVAGFVAPKLLGRPKQLVQGVALGMFLVGLRGFYAMAQSAYPKLPALAGFGEEQVLLADPFQKYLSGFGQQPSAPMTVEESVSGFGEQVPAPMTVEEASVAGFAGTLTF